MYLTRGTLVVPLFFSYNRLENRNIGRRKVQGMQRLGIPQNSGLGLDCLSGGLVTRTDNPNLPLEVWYARFRDMDNSMMVDERGAKNGKGDGVFGVSEGRGACGG